MAKVLVTGANGFIGKRLVLAFLDQGHEVYALCRIKGVQIFEEKPNLHLVWGDFRNQETLTNLPTDIHAAYYLIHSMTETIDDLIKTEQEVVNCFLSYAKNSSLKQIIYLGGIINNQEALSQHLKSRLLVEEALINSSIPTTILRASIIIGAGSASFEIIRDLCEKLPVMIAPRWVKMKCQPIGIGDVLFYLTSVLLNEKCFNKRFDIGGPQILTFKELMLNYCKFRHLRRWIIDVPLLTPRLSSYWLVFITSVRFSLCTSLIQSMRCNSVVQNSDIQETIPHKCVTYEEALKLAFQSVEQNDVISSWMDSWEIHGNDPKIEDYLQVPKEGCLKDRQKILIKDSKTATIERIWRIGGQKGYFAFNWAWGIRGLIDQMLGGVGLNRGRRHPSNISPGDSIDFWRVIVADKSSGNLILFAGMKIPGEAWLEFNIEKENGSWFLVQTATFRPKGISGRLYWYILAPFHFYLFRKMASSLAGRC